MTSITLFSLVILGLGACLSQSAIAAQGQEQHPTVVLDTSKGPITLELYPDKAPITVENFLKYVDDGFYDNLIFHRVIPKFMIQGGGMTDQMRKERERQASPDQERVWQRALEQARHDRHGTDRTIPTRPLASSSSTTKTIPISISEWRGLYGLRQGHRGMDVVDAIAEVRTANRRATVTFP